MSLKVSQLRELESLKPSSKDTNNFIVVTDDGTKRVGYDYLRKQVVNQYPYDDPRELSYSWSDIKTMCKNNKIEKDIRIGDYITLSLSGGEKTEMVVSGIDSHYRCGDTQTNHHIDFISKDCLKDPVAWNTNGHNNGTESDTNPFLASTLFTYLNDTVYNKIPEDIRTLISGKIDINETRYTAGSTSVTTSSGWGWKTLSYLWLPNEVEVFGHVVNGTPKYTEGCCTHYPIFRFTGNRVKCIGYKGNIPCKYWTRTAATGTSEEACIVTATGLPDTLNVTTASGIYVPLCFRIAG
jgi:hypothetical protein